MARQQVTQIVVGLLAGVCTSIVAGDGVRSAETCAQDDVIRVATGDDVSAGGARRELIKAWSADQSHPRVELVEVSRVADLKRGEMQAAAQATSCAAYDVLILDAAWTAEFAAAGLLRKIDSVPEGLVDKALETGIWRGSHYALPFAVDVGLLYRRREMPEPKAWGDLWDQARSAWTKERAGLITQLDDYEGGTVALQEMFGSAGAEVIDAEGAVVLDRPLNRERAATALERMRRAWNDTLLDRSLAAKEAEALADFAAGKAAYLRHWPYAFLRLAIDDRVDFEVSALPWPAALGGSNLAISAKSAKHEKAMEFIHYMIEENNQRALFACGGYAPVVKAAYSGVTPCATPRSRDDGPRPSTERLQKVADVIDQALETASRPKTEHYTRFSEVFRDCVLRAVHDERRTAAAAVSMIAEALEDAADGVLNESEPCR